MPDLWILVPVVLLLAVLALAWMRRSKTTHPISNVQLPSGIRVIKI